jgi:hypothetical protein
LSVIGTWMVLGVPDDELQFRPAQARLQQFRKQAELEVDDAIIGSERARTAYDNGVIQYQRYLTQARPTGRSEPCHQRRLVRRGTAWPAASSR